MWQIRLVVVGKLRQHYLRDGCAEYLKRLTRYARITVVELKEEGSTPQGKQRTNERLMAAIGESACVVALDSRGEQLSSAQMATFLQQTAMRNPVCFVIGGADGLPPSVLQSAALVLSFSRLTFPHQLFRLIFLEQLYRWCTIINDEPYHCGH